MIKSSKGKVKIVGNRMEILTEYSAITNSLIAACVDNGVDRQVAVNIVSEAHRIGAMTEEEREKEAKSKISKMLMDIIETINDDSDKEETVNE